MVSERYYKDCVCGNEGLYDKLEGCVIYNIRSNYYIDDIWDTVINLLNMKERMVVMQMGIIRKNGDYIKSLERLVKKRNGKIIELEEKLDSLSRVYGEVIDDDSERYALKEIDDGHGVFISIWDNVDGKEINFNSQVVDLLNEQFKTIQRQAKVNSKQEQEYQKQWQLIYELKEMLKNSYITEICENCEYGHYSNHEVFFEGVEYDFECLKKHFGNEHWKCSELEECDDFKLKLRGIANG